MTTYSEADDLTGARFLGVSLRGARFVGADLAGAVMRGVDVQGLDIDSPWLWEPGSSLLVNGIDVIAYVEAALAQRWPGRAQRRASDPAGLRQAWESLEAAWAQTVDRAATLPDGVVDASIGGEWSFAQTLRHLIYATDLWMGRAILDLDDPLHPIGISHEHVPGPQAASEATERPSYADILEVRSGRMTMVRNFLATVTDDALTQQRRGPHDPNQSVTVLSCLHVILGEEWDHLRYAERDLAAI